MFTVKVTRADKGVEVFESTNYLITKGEDLHPLINKVEVFCGSKKIASMKRKNAWYYTKFVFPTKAVQDKIIELSKAVAKEE